MATSFQQDFQRALAQMQGAVGPFNPIQLRPIEYSTPRYAPVDFSQLTNYANTVATMKPPVPPKPVEDIPWWKEILYGLQGIGGSVTNQLANWTDDQWSWTDIPLAETIRDIGVGQWQAWTDDDFGWKDVPLFGGLVHAGRNAKTTADIFSNIGWGEAEADPSKGWNFFERRKDNFDVGDILEFIGDVALDPTTYLTFGAGSAAKIGSRATLNAAEDVAKRYGVEVTADASGDIARGTAEQVMNKYLAKAKQSGNVNPALYERLAERKYHEVLNEIQNAGRVARAGAQNRIVNFDVPFTNIAVGFGNRANIPVIGNRLAVSDAAIGGLGASAVQDLFRQIGIVNPDDQLDVLRTAFGVDSAANLTTQQFRHLQDVLSRIEPAKHLPDRIVTEELLTLFRPNPNNLLEPFQQVDELIRRVEPKPSTVSQRTARTAKEALKLDKFVQDMGGKSRIGRFIQDRLLKSVNPRTLGSADELVNQAAGSIRDAENRMRGNTAQMIRDLKRIDKMAKGLTNEDLNKIPYLLERKFPGGQTEAEFLKGVSNPEQLKRVAEEVRKILARFAERESAVGNLTTRIPNYFPHVIKKDGMDKEKLLELMRDPEMQKYLGRSAANRFSQARKSFETFADWDDAIKALEDAKAKASPDEAVKIQEKIDQLTNLFERDTMTALTERYRKHIRSTAMKDLYNQFVKDGLIKLPKQNKDYSQLKNFERLDAETAKKLGLKEGTYVHKEVLKGLQKVESLFTVEGIQKFLDNATSVVNIWKNLVTTYIPSHHFYNFLGNVANNMMAGVKIRHYRRAGQLLKKMREGTLSADEQRFIQEAYDNGILAAGSMTDLVDPLRAVMADRNILTRLEHRVTHNRYARTMRGAGDFIDDYTRLALYLHGKQTLGDSRLAAQMVRKFLYNYGELTDADKVIRLFAPFWTWTKNNIPRQLIQFAQQPRFAASFVDLQNALQDDYNPDLIPDWMQDFLKVPGMANTFVNLRLPLQDLTNLDNPLRFTLGMLNPFIKMPFELQMNHQIYNDAPIDPYKAEGMPYDPAQLSKYLLNQAGIVNRLSQFSDPSTNILEDIGSLIFGRAYTVDPEKQAKINRYKQQEIQRLNRRKEQKKTEGR